MKPETDSPKDIDEYIAAFPAEIQQLLKKMRATIQKAAPQAVEAIKYRMPTFVLHQNLVHFAACKAHIGFYPTPSAIKAFATELSVYQSSKGAVQFPLDQPMPWSLITKIVQFRVKEVQALAKAKK